MSLQTSELNSAIESFADLFRTSPSLSDHLRAAERAANTDSPILILGEPGCGRSTIARIFHLASRRQTGPLIEVDPGAIPSTLFESELFGYRAGAFSGAEESVEGRVGRAEGGTLILDHVEETPLASQPKLLRFLAERRFAPLGGPERSADVRTVAIASEDLGKRVTRGTFRQDLFFRLEVLSYRIPPLRDRREDLPSICHHLLVDLAQRMGRPCPGLSRRADEWIAAYPWPGNLRQVRNVLERALIVHERGDLDPAPLSDASESRPRPLADVEREEIRRALAYTRGHQGRAAELLGISRKSLWQRRRRYGIP